MDVVVVVVLVEDKEVVDVDVVEVVVGIIEDEVLLVEVVVVDEDEINRYSVFIELWFFFLKRLLF
jgi:hypothetical protein